MHKCDACNKDFTQKKNLKRHMQNTHNLSINTDSNCSSSKKVAINKCPVCQLVFVERSSLRRHERIKHKMNITEPLRKSKDTKSKCITFKRSSLEDYPSLKKLIPEDYIYKVICIEDLKNNNIRAKFEIADCDEEMFFVWLSKLEKKSEVIYRVKSFTKSPNPKIVFNKVFRCIHNTFPNRFCRPHPKHTGCPATLSVRITKCSEALSVKNKMADNNVILIPLKAIVTLYHCHNHVFRNIKQYSITKKYVRNQTQYSGSLENHHDTENHLTDTNFDESFDSNSSSSSDISFTSNNSEQNYTDLIEEVILYETESNTLVTNDNIQKSTIDNDNFELSEEFDDYILVENVYTENSFNNNDTENELYQLLLDYDSVNERMVQQFQSNPKYFISAIKAFTSAMKSKLTSKESLSAVLNSFGKHEQNQ